MTVNRKRRRLRRRRRMTAYDALLELLQKAEPGQRVSSTNVNELVGIELSRTATRKAAMRLRRQGYNVVSSTGSKGGYELLPEGG